MAQRMRNISWRQDFGKRKVKPPPLSPWYSAELMYISNYYDILRKHVVSYGVVSYVFTGALSTGNCMMYVISSRVSLRQRNWLL